MDLLLGIIAYLFVSKTTIVTEVKTTPQEVINEVPDPLSTKPERAAMDKINRQSGAGIPQANGSIQMVRGGSLQKTSQEGLGTSEIKDQICQVFKENCQEAQRVAFCESGLRPQAISQTQDYGVFQIHLPSHASKIPILNKVDYLLDPLANIRLAHRIWLASGWNPWVSSFKCHGLA